MGFFLSNYELCRIGALRVTLIRDYQGGERAVAGSCLESALFHPYPTLIVDKLPRRKLRPRPTIPEPGDIGHTPRGNFVLLP
jgi:hypothetical protein